MEATVVQILAKFRADVSDFNKRVGEVESQLTKLQKSTNDTSRGVQDAFGKMEYAADAFAQKLGVVAAVAGTAFVAMGMKSFQAAAEVEELDTVMQVVGSTTGVTYQKLLDTADAIRDNGIEYASAQQMAIKFAKNSLDVGKAADVARVAQDLAVISQANSTDTANRLTHAVLNLNSMMLRNAGVQTTVSQAVRTFSQEYNVAVKSMTTAQKQAAVINAILDEGGRIAGVYSMSMSNAGKVLRSFPRITKQLQVAFGQSLIKPLGPLILQVYELYKNFANLFEEGAALRPIIEALTFVLQKLVDPITAAVTKAVEFVKNMKPMTTGVGELGAQIQRYLPVIGALGAALATIGGASLLKQVPIFGALFGALNPVLVGFTVLVALSPKIRDAFMNLVESLKPLAPAFLKAFDNVVGFINILITGLASALNKVANFFKKFTSDAKSANDALDILTSVGIAMTIAGIVILIGKLKIAVKNMLALHGTAILLTAALALLVYAFYKTWNSSEAFRKGVILIAKAWLFLGEQVIFVASLVYNTFALMLRGIANFHLAMGKLRNDPVQIAEGKKSLTDIDNFNAKLMDMGNSIKDARNSLDTLNKPIKWKDLLGNAEKFIPGLEKIKEIFSGKVAKTKDGGGTDDATTKALANRITKIKEALQAYSDFIQYDFKNGLMKDAETARDTVLKSLDMVKKVFDAQAEGLSGAALKNLQNTYGKLNTLVRDLIPQAESVGEAFDLLNTEIEAATRKLEQVTQRRAEAISELSAMMREPFGEPSEIQKGLSSASASVDSIISTYDKLVEIVTKRFEGFDERKRDSLLEYLETTTTALVMLAKEREKAVEKWREATNELNEILAAQKDFSKQLISTVKSYGRALFDVAKSNDTSVIRAIKTSTGVLITSISEASSGLTGVTKQLRDRLANIKSFMGNIRTLIGKGLNKDYIKQLLEAGPEAASELTALLTTAGADQITEINGLYAEMGMLSDTFGADMAESIYGQQRKNQEAIVKAATDDLEAIKKAMDLIRAAIEEKMLPLKNSMANLGKDAMAALIAELTAKKTELVTLATSIATAIATAMAAAMAAIKVDTSGFKMTPGGDGGAVGNPYQNRDKNYDAKNGMGFNMSGDVIVNNYNPAGSGENAFLTLKAMERLGYGKK